MRLALALSWKPNDRPENRIFVAAIATILVGAAQAVLGSFDLFGSKAVTELAAFIACMWFLPSEPRAPWSAKLACALVGLGLFGGALWVASIGFPARGESQFLTWDKVPIAYYVLGVFTGCVAAPLFEEKVVRHLLLTGAAQYLGRAFAALAVSALFAWVHTDGMISAFLFSLALCAGVYIFNLDTLQRSVIHGVVNLVIMHWTLIYPNL